MIEASGCKRKTYEMNKLLKKDYFTALSTEYETLGF